MTHLQLKETVGIPHGLIAHTLLQYWLQLKRLSVEFD
jgi:hypothetical protein